MSDERSRVLEGLALTTSGCDTARVRHRRRLPLDSGPSSVVGDLAARPVGTLLNLKSGWGRYSDS